MACLIASLVSVPQTSFAATDDPSAGTDFFEERIRPVLVDRCYKCHSSDADKPSGGLRLDTREGIRKGGEIGPAVVPGDEMESLLLSAVRYENLEMPPDEKLPDDVIEDFRKWIELGAPDSRTTGSTANREVEDPAKPADGMPCMMLMPQHMHSVSFASPLHCWPNWVVGSLLARAGE